MTAIQKTVEVQELQELCQEGHLYQVERWIGDGKPLQLADPNSISRRRS